MSRSDADREPASFTILAQQNQALGATHFSGAGLRRCQNELKRLGDLHDAPSDMRNWSICGLCAELVNADPFDVFNHQPTYTALVTKYISSAASHGDQVTSQDLRADDNESTNNQSTAISEVPGAGSDLLESIVLSSAPVDPLKLDKDGPVLPLPVVDVPSFDSSGVERYRRFTVVWKGPGFHWSGGVMGISITAMTGRSSVKKFWQRPIWTSSDARAISQRLSIVADWLKDCEDNHPTCRSMSTATLPKRVLLLEDRDLPPDQVRLALTNSSMGAYAALSYCWGSTAHLRTTKDSIADHQQGILIKHMPKTFQDAIEVCRYLDIKYLWIDSLCIMQGDLSDWMEAAAQMDDIYRHARITLAAAAGEHSNAGLFHPFVQSVSFPSEDDDTNPPTLVTVSIRLNSYSQRPYCKLHTRGWTFQEDLLSRRYVQFDAKQIRWRCLSEARSEDGLLDGMPVERSLSIPTLSTFDATQLSFEGVHELWKRVAEAYSDRNLTVESDRLPALAGLSKTFQKLLQDEPFLGIWRNRIIEGLLWSATISDSSRTGSNGLPSWSWLSCGNTVRFDSFWELFEDDAKSFQAEPIAKVITASLSWSAAPFVSIPTATLILKGRTTVAKMVADGIGPTAYTHLCVEGLTDHSRPSCDLDQLWDPPSTTVTLLELALVTHRQNKDVELEKREHAALVLVPSHPPGAYRRIGVTCLNHSQYESLFLTSDEESISLI